jgi:predicted Fe-Mo cluster-binding NifX family protein
MCIWLHLSFVGALHMSQLLSPELALRIGLAARALPGITPKCMVALLIDALKLPLTDAKLKGLTIYQLRTSGNGALKSLPRPILRKAIAYLWDKAGIDIIDTSIPAVAQYTEGDMPASVRLAIASEQGMNLNGHFGTCPRFLIYQVSRDETRLIDVRGTAGGKNAEDPHGWRTELVEDCNLMLVKSIGIPDMARIMKAGIYPVKYPQGCCVQDALGDIQQILHDAPPPWLGKLMGQQDRFRRRLPRLHVVPN